MVIPLFVGRERSIQALNIAMLSDKRIILVAQKRADVDDPKADHLYPIGTVATILQLLKLPDGTIKVLVEGVDRARIETLHEGEHYAADATLLPDLVAHEREMDVLARAVITQFEQYVKLNRKVPPEVLTALSGIEHTGRLADTVANHMSLKIGDKQKVLEILDVRKRLEHILVAIEGEMQVLQIDKRIRGRVKAQMERSQRQHYLNEQLKAIQKELAEMDDASNEINALEPGIDNADTPKEPHEKASDELNQLNVMSPVSADLGEVDVAPLMRQGMTEQGTQGQVAAELREWAGDFMERARKLEEAIKRLEPPPLEAQIASLGRQLARRDEQLAERDKEFERQNAAFYAQVSARDAQIDWLIQQVKELQQRLDSKGSP